MGYKPDFCVFHAGCDDGFGALWAIKKRWPDVVPIEGKYSGTSWPAGMADKNILFVDFSLKRDQMIELANGGLTGEIPRSIVVLDHHKTAEAELKDWDAPDLTLSSVSALMANQSLSGAPLILAKFDMEKSGARLAWEFALPDVDVPKLILHVEDRDLWRFSLPDTEAVSAALRTYDHDHALWDRFNSKLWTLVDEGRSVLRGHKRNVASMCRNAYWAEVAGVRAIVVNVPYHYASDCANELLKAHPDAPFAAAWFMRADGQRQWSLRSENGRMDVSEIASQFGGGGHRNAAGFQEPFAG